MDVLTKIWRCKIPLLTLFLRVLGNQRDDGGARGWRGGWKNIIYINICTIDSTQISCCGYSESGLLSLTLSVLFSSTTVISNPSSASSLSDTAH